jgi:hypothetical protein
VHLRSYQAARKIDNAAIGAVANFRSEAELLLYVEKHPTWLAPSVEGKELSIGAASVVQWRPAEPPAEAKTDTSVVLCRAR